MWLFIFIVMIDLDMWVSRVSIDIARLDEMLGGFDLGQSSRNVD